MLSRIKDWCYAFAVCKKYKLIWNPFVKLKDAYYSYTGVIGVNPFDSYFMSNFLHEVGHHVHNKRVTLKNYLKAQDGELRFLNGNEAGRNIFKVLEAEARASRFAAKTGRADKKHLVGCFQTYTASIFRCTINPVVVTEFSKIVDVTYKGIRSIEK